MNRITVATVSADLSPSTIDFGRPYELSLDTVVKPIYTTILTNKTHQCTYPASYMSFLQSGINIHMLQYFQSISTLHAKCKSSMCSIAQPNSVTFALIWRKVNSDTKSDQKFFFTKIGSLSLIWRI